MYAAADLKVWPAINEAFGIALLEAQAAEDTAAVLAAALPDIAVGIVHGRMPAPARERTMARFKAAEIGLLVATTVVEVGVDVPNASLMVIENAERMGLAQLHQLRGRVGRSALQSYCFLLYQSPMSEEGRSRLRAMTETTDGFVIAERDLQLRWAGDVFGTRQAGMPSFRLIDLVRDRALLEQAHAEAERWLAPILNYDPQATERDAAA